MWMTKNKGKLVYKKHTFIGKVHYWAWQKTQDLVFRLPLT